MGSVLSHSCRLVLTCGQGCYSGTSLLGSHPCTALPRQRVQCQPLCLSVLSWASCRGKRGTAALNPHFLLSFSPVPADGLTVLFSHLSACFREGLVFLVWSLECVCMKSRQRKTPIYNFTRGPRNLLGLHVQGRMAACCQWPPKHPCPFDLCCQAGFCVPGLS